MAPRRPALCFWRSRRAGGIWRGLIVCAGVAVASDVGDLASFPVVESSGRDCCTALAKHGVDAASARDADLLRCPFRSLLLALFGGCFSASGANVMAWSTREGQQRDLSALQQKFSITACAVLNLFGIFAFALSCTLGGAVAVVMPMQVTSNLLTNMYWQTALGIKRYDQIMVLSTLLLVCAIAQLIDLGPQEPVDLDVASLLQAPAARAWCAVLLMSATLALGALASLRHEPPGSLKTLLSATSAVTLTTVIGSSLSKCFGLLEGFQLAVVGGLYLCGLCVCLVVTVYAAGVCDVSIYIPAQLASQLVINMLTGYLVWGDAEYVEKPVAYVLVYAICTIAVCMMSASLHTEGEQAKRKFEDCGSTLMPLMAH
eukprot:TRINITY_DN30349_c0_g1_i1.p1 TRINITY_DN30349_c0_g1~~TRINITY_DN30349_c0_g1_i1.p1  ORF type:complete len:373 (-),score=79.65 TRINITY_DN30349_c0_g1_i1:88-1206(-)